MPLIAQNGNFFKANSAFPVHRLSAVTLSLCLFICLFVGVSLQPVSVNNEHTEVTNGSFEGLSTLVGPNK